MKGAILVSAAVSSLVSIIGTIVALTVLVPAVVEAQQASNILAERAAVVDGTGTERVIMSTGPGARSAVGVWSQDGVARAIMSTGGTLAEGGTRPESAGVAVLSQDGIPRAIIATGGPGGPPEADGANVQVFAPEGPTGLGGPGPIASLGTTLDGAGSIMYLRDRQGQIRISLVVNPDGNPSIRMLDANGNVTWQAQ